MALRVEAPLPDLQRVLRDVGPRRAGHDQSRDRLGVAARELQGRLASHARTEEHEGFIKGRKNGISEGASDITSGEVLRYIAQAVSEQIGHDDAAMVRQQRSDHEAEVGGPSPHPVDQDHRRERAPSLSVQDMQPPHR